MANDSPNDILVIQRVKNEKTFWGLIKFSGLKTFTIHLTHILQDNYLKAIWTDHKNSEVLPNGSEICLKGKV